MDLKEILADIAAFADSEDAVQIDKGLAVFQRDRKTYECRLVETASGVEVDFDGRRLSYRRFLAEELGRMSILAGALRDKRKALSPFIDVTADMTSSLDVPSNSQSALTALGEACKLRPFGETRLIFLTADAGHGKTALLRQLTRRLAEDYLARKSDMILFHIDTQGRSFVRLEEAVARDLGQLRMFGLFYPGVLRLVRSGLLALAIDGFDELLAEIGVGEAYSGLGALLRQLEGKGVVIASARSAYFLIENYAAQTRLLTSLPDTHVTVEHMRLQPWSKDQTIEYFRLYRGEDGGLISDPVGLYDGLCANLGPDHPVLRRPFLVYRMAALVASNAYAPGELALESGQSSLQVVPKVIQALLKREVEEKWRDPNGEPYLTVDQHLTLLSAIADEMWTQGKNSLPVEVVQVVCETVLDELKIPPAHRVQIIHRVGAHALLPPEPGGDLSFDHEEFLNYFLAARLTQLMKARDNFGLQRFCELHPLPIASGLWAANAEEWSRQQAEDIVARLGKLTTSELRSTYLKQNAGTIAAQLATRLGNDEAGAFEFDSMYFEGDLWSDSALKGSRFKKCTFIGIDLSNARWEDCSFESCDFDGLIFNERTQLEGCRFAGDCSVLGVLKRREGEEQGLKNFVFEECRHYLEELGAQFESAEPIKLQVHPLKPVPKEKKQALDIFFRIFNRNSGVTENVAKLKLGAGRYSLFRKELLPQMLKHNVVRATEYTGGGLQERWELTNPLEIILRAEDPSSSAPESLKEFWKHLRG
jgi:hypothetical protein